MKFNFKKYKYSQKYTLKQSNNSQKALTNSVNRNFSFHLTEISNSKQLSPHKTNLILPKLNNTNQQTNNIHHNANPSMLSFQANKSSSLNNLITKLNTNNLPILTKNNLNISKLHLKYGTND